MMIDDYIRQECYLRNFNSALLISFTATAVTVDDDRGLDERRMLATKLQFGFIGQFQAKAVTVDDDRGLHQ